MTRLIAAMALAALLAGAAAAGPSGQRVLVLLNDADAMRTSHARFLADLEGRGYSLDVRAIDDSSLQLKRWDEWLYDKAVVLGSAKGERSSGGRATWCWRQHRRRRRLLPGCCRPPPPELPQHAPAPSRPTLPCARSPGRSHRRRAASGLCGCWARPVPGGGRRRV